MFDEIESKYANLLVNRCLDLSKSNSLFIHYYNDNKSLIDKVIVLAKEKGIDDIYLDELDKEERHEHLSKSLKEIENDSYFDSHVWDEYAKKNAAFLMISTEFPHYFDDISSENMTAAALKSRTTRPIYREKQALNEKMPLDVIAIFIKDILEDLGCITGDMVTEDIIDEIFSKFCLGK